MSSDVVCERFIDHHGTQTDELAGCHEIGEFLNRLRKPYYSEDDNLPKRIAVLKQMLEKQPFERTAEDNQNLFPLLRLFPCFRRVPDTLLKSLCATVVTETWAAGLTVFGSTGLHIVLRGSLSLEDEYPTRTITFEDEHGEELAESVVEEDESDYSEVSTVESSIRTMSGSTTVKRKLRAGSYFGTLEKIEDESEANAMRALTHDECELMKISVSSFKHISDIIKQKAAQEIMELIQSCEFFSGWPQKSLNEIAACLTWCRFTKSTVIVDEGTVSDNMYLIKTGVCSVKNRIDIKLDSPRRGLHAEARQLVVGQLGPGAEVGERGAVLHLPSKSKVEVRSDAIVCGCIAHEHIETMDEVTRALFRQVTEEKESSHDEENIKRIYVEKQSEKSWQMQKRKALQEVIHHTGIQPTYGKWSRNPTIDDVRHLSAQVQQL